MNKIYKVIWNVALGTWVAVSEITKSKTKSGQVNQLNCETSTETNKKIVAPQHIKLSLSVISLAIGMVMSPMAFAAAGVTTGAALGTNSTAISACLLATDQAVARGHHSIALGCLAETGASNSYGIAIGNEAKSMGPSDNGSIALGRGAGVNSDLSVTTKQDSVAIGANAIANAGKGSINNEAGSAVAIGTAAKAISAGSSIAIGDNAQATGKSSVSIGGNPFSSGNKAEGDFSVALGSGANVNEGAENGIAFGRGASVSKDASNGVAVGAKSLAANRNSSAFGTNAQAKGNNAVAVGNNALANTTGAIVIGSDSVSFASGGVSIGGNTNASAVATAYDLTDTTKTTQNIAERRLVVDGTAALNKAVLTQQTVKAKIDNVDIELTFDKGTDASPSKVIYNKDTYTGAAAAALYSALSSGGAITHDQQSIAIGTSSAALKSQSVAIGANALVTGDQALALGANTRASGDSSIAIGGDSIDKTMDSSSLDYKGGTKTASDYYEELTGAKLNTGPRYIETESKGAASVAIGVRATSEGFFSTAIGSTATAKGDTSVAVGTKAVSSGLSSIAVGVQSLASGDESIAMGTAASASKSGTMAFGMNAVASEKDAVSFGTNAKATTEGGVALGSDSVSSTVPGAKGYDPLARAVSAASGTAWTSTLGAVSVGVRDTADPTKSTQTRQITNLAAGTQDTDAVNVAQLKSAGLKYKGDTATTPAGLNEFGRVLGDTTNIVGGVTDPTKLTSNNIGVVSNGTDILTVQLAKNLDLTATGSVKTGNTQINNTGVLTPQVVVGTGANTTTLTSTINGLDVGNDKLTNVADGTAAKDAVNYGQLDALKNQTWKLQTNTDTASAVKSSDTVKFLDGNNIKITRAGNDITIATSATPTFDKATITAAPTVGTDATNKAYVDGSINTLKNNGLKIGANNNTTGVTHKLGNQLDIVAGIRDAAASYVTDNLTTDVSQDAATGKTTVTVSMKKDASFDSVTTGASKLDNSGLTITGGPSVTSTGVDAGNKQITGVASAGDITLAANANKAVNAGDLNTVRDNLTNAGLNFTDDAGTVIDRNLGQTLAIKGGATGGLTDGNIGIVADPATGALNVKLAEELNDLKQVTAGSGTDQSALTKDGLTVTDGSSNTVVGSDQITVGAGAGKNTVTIDGTDGEITGLTNTTLTDPSFATAGRVATEEQLKTIQDAQAATDDIAVKYDTKPDPIDPTKNVIDRDNVTFAGTPGTTAVVDPSTGEMSMSGGTSLNNVASAGDITDIGNAYNAVNAGDLNNAVQGVTNKGLLIGANNNTTGVTHKLGNQLAIVAGIRDAAASYVTDNLTMDVSQDAATGKTTVTVSMKKDASFDSVTTGASKLDNSGLTITGGPSVTSTGVDAGNKQITGVASAGDITLAANANKAVNAGDLNTVRDNLTNAGLNFTDDAGTVIVIWVKP